MMRPIKRRGGYFRCLFVGAVLCFLAACGSPKIATLSRAHIGDQDNPVLTPTAVPQPVRQDFALPQPKSRAKTPKFSVVVNNVPVQELLFSLARDAKLNVDVHTGIQGVVSLNAIDQTLPQLLHRIAKQVDMRFEMDGSSLIVMPDTPFLRIYPIDYVNMDRSTVGSVSVSTQLLGSGASSPGGANAGAASHSNNSTTRIDNKAHHYFWSTLVQNVKDILRETDKILPEGSSETVVEQANTQSTTGTGSATSITGHNNRSTTNNLSLASSPNPATLQNMGSSLVRRTTFREAASVIAHPETGILSIRATTRQHEKIQEFLDKVQRSATRQVMIEATIVEVQLSNEYQQGIDWSRITLGTGFSLSQTGARVPAAGGMTNSFFEINYRNTTSDGAFFGAIKMLDAFGSTKVLSSPKLSVINNQTAVLKVVDNTVYFTIKADTTQNQTTTLTTFTTTLNQVPVGLVMNITPQISADGQIVLNVRPSVSRVIGTVQDPNPALKAAGVSSEIPIIRTREMESMLRVQNGNIAVMGGLMEDALSKLDSGTPGLSQIPWVGELFTQRNDTVRKTELVVFLRPLIINDASIYGDYSGSRDWLPRQDFFTRTPDPARPAEGNAARGSLQ